MHRLAPFLPGGRVKSPPRGASGSRRLLLGRGWVGRRGFGSRRGFCHWIRSIVLFNDVCRDLLSLAAKYTGTCASSRINANPFFAAYSLITFTLFTPIRLMISSRSWLKSFCASSVDRFKSFCFSSASQIGRAHV